MRVVDFDTLVTKVGTEFLESVVNEILDDESLGGRESVAAGNRCWNLVIDACGRGGIGVDVDVAVVVEGFAKM